MSANAHEPVGHWPSYGHKLGENLRALRIMRGLSQGRLAVLAGLSRNVVSNLERNENSAHRCSDPVLSTVYKLARALRVPPVVLLPAAHRPVNGICAGEAVGEGVDLLWPARPEDTRPFTADYRISGRRGQTPDYER
ncbi:helix-turn-helix domain-containing protein [Corynebacterium maris]|uniref:helix-turn-helix domain-containing protein n=1 Tax=Corynebacterium maris TaxID=575200 RepID=UPI00059F8B12|nr:helix-turn-helix transcriptional regulator [Corynebacterium maris]